MQTRKPWNANAGLSCYLVFLHIVHWCLGMRA